MTRDEAIKKWVIPAIKNTWNEKKCKEILKALEQEPTTKNDLVVDCISRERLKQIVYNITTEYDTETIHIDRLIDEIDNMPSVTPHEPKTGHWIFDDKCREHGHCSRCGYGSVDLVDGEPHIFCRNCGCHMVESQESEW